MLLSPEEAADIREVVRAVALSETDVKVLSAAEGADDAYGRSSLTYPDPAAVDAVPARVWLHTVRERRDGVWVEVSTWAARVPLDVSVGKGDRLVDVTTGHLYEVATVVRHNSVVGELYQYLTLVRVEGSVL